MGNPPVFLRFLFALLLYIPVSAQDFWQHCHGPSGGQNRAVVIGPTGTIYVGTYGCGVFRSMDNGGSWQVLKGLRGDADANADKQVTVEEMERYLLQNVPDQARYLRNREQTPQVIGKDKSKVLVKY